MATTSLWRIKGWLGNVVIYVENPDKTTNPAAYQKEGQTAAQAQGLEDVIAYAVSSQKTLKMDTADEDAPPLQQLVTGVNCCPATAREEMLAVKHRFGKENGTVAYHGYQSFAEGEVTPAQAHEIGVKLAQQLWGDRYQVLVATHLDKASHLHTHFVLNTVSFVDGLKFHRTAKDYRQMREASDALCRAYGLSVIETPAQGKGKQYGEWRAEQQQRPTWRGLVRTDVDDAIRQSVTERQFFDILRRKGYEIKTGKDISVRPPGKERFVRLARNFGEGYTLENIRRRILQQPRRTMPHPASTDRRTAAQPRKSHPYKLRGSLTHARRLTGLRALYYHYCYLLGVFPKTKQRQNSRRLHFLLREDLRQLDAICAQTRLLAREGIDDAAQLSAYKASIQAQIEKLTGERSALYRLRRTAAVKTDAEKLAENKAQTAALSHQLTDLRKEVVLCDDIARRSGGIAEKIRTARAWEQENNPKKSGKEKTKDEHSR